MVLTAVRTSEEILISRTRAGDMAAYDELYRRHVDDAAKVARIVTDDADDAPDIVNEAFTRVLARLSDGGGPDDDLGPYLRTIVRRLAVDRYRGRARTATADTDTLESLPTVDDPMGRADDKHLVRRAFETLPERWQRVLWHTEIEGRSPASLASVLDMAPNAVAALAYRAREGLRQAYLTVNLPHQASRECRTFTQKLPAYARGTLGPTATSEVTDHLAGCVDCRERRDELLLLASDVRGILAPALLLPTVGWTAAAAGGVATGAAAGGFLSWFTPAKWAAASGGSGVAVAGATGGGLAAVLATVAVFTVPFGTNPDADVAGDPAAAPSMSIQGPMTTQDDSGDVGGAGSGDDERDDGLDDAATLPDTKGPEPEPEAETDKTEPTGRPEAARTPEPERTEPADPGPGDFEGGPAAPPESEEDDPEPEPDPTADTEEEAVNIEADLGLEEILGINLDLGLGGLLGVEIR